MAATGRVKPSIAPPIPSRPMEDNGGRPPMPPRPSTGYEEPSEAIPPPGPPVAISAEETYDDAPPSYEDAMAETLSPVDGPRREYNPPDASSSRRSHESGADPRPSVYPGKDREARSPYGNPTANSSSESFDMLPSTPPESHSGSPPTSPVARQQSILKIHKAPPPPEDNPPKYEPVAEGQLQAPQDPRQRRPSSPGFRPMNLGVPNRKPVPRSSSSGA